MFPAHHIGGGTGPIPTAFVFFLIPHIRTNITYALVGTVYILCSIWIKVLTVTCSFQLLSVIQTSRTIAKDIQQKVVTLTATQ